MVEGIITFFAVVGCLFVVYLIIGTVCWCFLGFKYRELFKWMVVRIGYKKPKRIFHECMGSEALMYDRGVYDRYKSYHIPKSVEKKWLLEMKAIYEDAIEKSTNTRDILGYVRSYYNITMRLDGVEGMEFLRGYIDSKRALFETTAQREMMDVAVHMTVYMIRDELEVRKEHLMWALEILRELIKGKITFTDYFEHVYVTGDGKEKEYSLEWRKGARLYNEEDEKDAIRYLISTCKGALSELMYYGSGFKNSDIN